MEKRKLGNIPFNATIITLGGCGPGLVSQNEADTAVEMAVRKYGLNMIDVAPSYGEAEERLHPWITNHRKQFFVAEKTTERTKEGAEKALKSSITRTGAEYFDLYQFHAVKNMKEVNQILGPGGAMEAVKEAKETGLIKHIGITGHDNIQVFVNALDLFAFDTVLAPVSVASMVEPHPANDYHPLLEKAREEGVGIIAIKSILKRRWTQEYHKYKTWYEPMQEQEAIDKALWFTLSQEGVTTCPLPCDVRLWPMVLDAAERYKKLTLDQEQQIIAWARKYGSRPLFPINNNHD